jgi:hypothetical protein
LFECIQNAAGAFIDTLDHGRVFAIILRVLGVGEGIVLAHLVRLAFDGGVDGEVRQVEKEGLAAGLDAEAEGQKRRLLEVDAEAEAVLERGARRCSLN